MFLRVTGLAKRLAVRHIEFLRLIIVPWNDVMNIV